jgi:hypothetical protein
MSRSGEESKWRGRVRTRRGRAGGLSKIGEEGGVILGRGCARRERGVNEVRGGETGAGRRQPMST